MLVRIRLLYRLLPAVRDHAPASRRGEKLEHGRRVRRQHSAEVERHRVGPEEVVVERGVGVDPLLRVHRQEFVEEIQSELVAYVQLESLLHLAFLSLRKVELREEIQVFDARPDFARHRAAQLTDQLQLVLLGAALHDGTARPHLGHDASGAP